VWEKQHPLFRSLSNISHHNLKLSPRL
jgi:hypothetical protein